MRIEQCAEHGTHWVTCLDCGAQWHDTDPPEMVSEGDGFCDEQASNETATHWGYGSGMPGCLFDSGPCFAETQEQAIDAVLRPFSGTGNESDLPANELEAAKADLRECGLHYFPHEIARELGASLVQVWEEQGPCPEDNDN